MGNEPTANESAIDESTTAVIDMLTAKQAADELGYHVNHVYRLLALGAMAGTRLGNYWLIDVQEVARVKAEQDDEGRYHHGKTTT